MNATPATAQDAALTAEVAPVTDAPVPAQQTPAVAAPDLTPRDVWTAVGNELAQRRLLLAMRGLRMHFRRDESGSWFLTIASTHTKCEASEDVGKFDSLSPARIDALVTSVKSLVSRSSCGMLYEEPAPDPRPRADLEPWVRPTGAVYAVLAGSTFAALWSTDDGRIPATFAKGQSAAVFSGLGIGFAGGAATMFVPDRYARPTLELSVSSSLALFSLGLAMQARRGVDLPAYGDYATASGYALTSVMIAADMALSSPDAMLGAPVNATAQDVPRRALTPWLVYTPAMVGAVVSTARAFGPGMDDSDRELAVGVGLTALVPATAGLVLGLVNNSRSEKAHREPWMAGGPRGSFGLTVGGVF